MKQNVGFTEVVGEVLLKDNLNKNMPNGIGKLDVANVKSALVYGVLFGLVAVGDAIISSGNVFNLSAKDLASTGIIAGLAVAVSLVKNLLTTDSGKFLNQVTVK